MKRQIGAHVSASGGLEKAIERAHKIGANCAQIFSGSPRVWKRKELSTIDTRIMFSKQKELGVDSIFTHSLYLANLATNKPDLLRKSFDALKYDLEFDSLINGSGIIVHIGSHTGRGWEAVKEQVAQQIAALIKVTPKDSTFLIENSAGQKGKLCSDLEEIRWLLDRVADLIGLKSQFGVKHGTDKTSENFENKLGWCFDTCHAHAAGYSMGTQARSLTGKFAIEEISKLDLWDTLKCVHVNDSRDDFDSGRDRHDNLGEGNIPIEDFEYFVNYKKVIDIPLLLEVPGEDKKGPNAENIKKLQGFCK